MNPPQDVREANREDVDAIILAGSPGCWRGGGIVSSFGRLDQSLSVVIAYRKVGQS